MHSPELSSPLADRYRIERELGQGGMAMVYLAQDLKHHRLVAIKVLRPELAAVIGAERFLSEIRTTAGLQHPHILPLFDSGLIGGTDDQSGRPYYVMPYVEGETLRDRLAREKQLPVADAIRIATEVAGALDYAHRRGIVHRDIKPENILLQEGSALVADFGIALAITTAGGSRITESGLSLGTPQYMSPEQAMAERHITNRSDIFALGWITYEMLVGNPPFSGVSLQAIVARVMTESPDSIRQVRDRVTPAVEDAVFTALAKSPADRFASAAQFAAALNHSGVVTTSTIAAAPATTRDFNRAKWPMAALAVLALLAGWGWLRPKPAATHSVPARVTIPIAPDRLLALDDKAFDISPDGSQIVYVGESEGRNLLFLRPLSDFEAHPLEGTDGASGPFFSYDGRWIGFAAGGKLKKVLRTGGAPTQLANIGGTGWGGGVWRQDGTIFYSNIGNSLYRIPEGGGTPSAIQLKLSSAAPAGTATSPVRSPSLLPDGEHALVSMGQSVSVVTLATGETRPVVNGRSGMYLPTGHLLFDETEGRMRLAPFDPKKLQITGSAVPAFEAFRSPGGGPAQVGFSANGTLVYVAGGFNRTLVKVDRNGRESLLPFPARGYRFPRLSPDGLHLAVTVDPRPSQIWVIDLAKATSIPVTSSAHNIAPVWSPSGDRIAFTQGAFTQWVHWPLDHVIHTITWKKARPGLFVYGWTRTHGLTGQLFDSAGRSIVSFQLDDSIPTRLSPPESGEWQPATSPDEAWLAYASWVTGSSEVYVRPFAGGEAVQISNGGGVEPRWSADGRTLYFRHASHIMAVPVRTQPRFETLGPAHEVLAGSYDFSQDDNWDVGPDGSILLIRGDPASIGKFMVVTNWFDEIRAAGP